jgi:hypothetical protein
VCAVVGVYVVEIALPVLRALSSRFETTPQLLLRLTFVVQVLPLLGVPARRAAALLAAYLQGSPWPEKSTVSAIVGVVLQVLFAVAAVYA